MYLVFEKSNGRFKSNCNILALTWTPYLDDTKFRKALFEYHQRQLLNISNTPLNLNNQSGNCSGQSSGPLGHLISSTRTKKRSQDLEKPRKDDDEKSVNFKKQILIEIEENSRLAELYKRLDNISLIDKTRRNGNQSIESPRSGADAMQKLRQKYGQMDDFGWLVIGNIGRIVGISLTSIVPPPSQQIITQKHIDSQDRGNKKNKNNNVSTESPDLIQLDSSDDDLNNDITNDCNNHQVQSRVTDPILASSAAKSNDRNINDYPDNRQQKIDYEQMRPDKISSRSNHNLRGHLDEIILVKWNDLYQKLATVDSKGNVLIWCKVNDKFTIQTPFYNRTKSVADFQWSNDGKTALICYTDSFILVGSSTCQRHWHSMLNLDDYHITCGSWTPKDQQILLGVSNGNVVVIDLAHSELTELVVSQTNIRTMSWSNANLNLTNFDEIIDSERVHDNIGSSDKTNILRKDKQVQPHFLGSSMTGRLTDYTYSRRRSITTVINQRRLSRDCSVFSRYRFDANQSNRDKSGKFSKSDASIPRESRLPNILAIDYANNTVDLFEGGLKDTKPRTIVVQLESYIIQWSTDGQILAVGGFNIHTVAPSVMSIRCQYINVLKFYSRKGILIYERPLRYTRYPITALTWAHDNRRLFVATGPRLHCAKVFFGIPQLKLLAMSCIQKHTRLANKADNWRTLNQGLKSRNVLMWQSPNCPINLLKIYAESRNETLEPDQLSNRSVNRLGKCDKLNSINSISHNNSNIYIYNLPRKLLAHIDNQLCSETLRQPLDGCLNASDIIWLVPKHNQRLYCTLVCYTSERKIGPGGAYNYQNSWTQDHDSVESHNHLSSDSFKLFVLYVEFAGSFIPILRARRIGVLKPEFIIFDPQGNELTDDPARRNRKVSDVGVKGTQLERNQNSYQTPFYNKLMAQNQSHSTGHDMTSNCSNLHDCSSLGTATPARDCSKSITSPKWNQKSMNLNCNGYNRAIKQLDFITKTNNDSMNVTSETKPTCFYNYEDEKHLKQDIDLGLITPEHASILRDQNFRTDAWTDYLTKAFSSLEQKSTHNNGPKLTEKHHLVRIKSNIWGTKFKILNESNSMIRNRAVLGTLVYKASLLHLQPRQIFLTMKDMSNYCCLCSMHHHLKRKPCAKNKRPKSNRIDESLHHNLKEKDNFYLKKSTPISDESKKFSLIAGNNLHRGLKEAETSSAQSTPCKSSFVGLMRSSSHLSQNSIPHERRQKNLTANGGDILTLGLDTKNQLKFQMSLTNLAPIKNRVSSTPGEKERGRDRRYMAQAEVAMASDKTLKSIKTITQMIVDLSERAKNDEKSEEKIIDNYQGFEELSNSHQASSSINYIPPETPIHRPKRQPLKSRLAIRTDMKLSGTQSAHSSPMRSHINQNYESYEDHMLNYNNQGDFGQTDRGFLSSNVRQALGERISNSAKRIFSEGSFKSLSMSFRNGSNSRSSSIQVDDEDSQPLVRPSRSKSDAIKQNQKWRSEVRQSRGAIRQGLVAQFSESSGNLIEHVKDRCINYLTKNQESTSIKHVQRSCSVDRETSSHRPHGNSDFRLSRRSKTLKNNPLDSDSMSDFTDNESLDAVPIDTCKTKHHLSSNKLATKNNNNSPCKSDTLPALEGFRVSYRRRSICGHSQCCCSRELHLKNRPPLWNELSQVYQLDFGGRVTQESAKNLQIDFEGQLALQFGRMDRCSYTLDYKYPFNSVQAMSIALASLTQRLK